MCKYCIHPDKNGEEFYYKKVCNEVLQSWYSLYYSKKLGGWRQIFGNPENGQTTSFEVNYCPMCGKELDECWFDLGTMISYFLRCVCYIDSLPENSNIKLTCYDSTKGLIYVEYRDNGEKLSSATITVSKRHCSTDNQFSTVMHEYKELCEKLNNL